MFINLCCLSDCESADADETTPLHHIRDTEKNEGVTTEMEWKGQEFYKGKLGWHGLHISDEIHHVLIVNKNQRDCFFLLSPVLFKLCRFQINNIKHFPIELFCVYSVNMSINSVKLIENIFSLFNKWIDFQKVFIFSHVFILQYLHIKALVWPRTAELEIIRGIM